MSDDLTWLVGKMFTHPTTGRACVIVHLQHHRAINHNRHYVLYCDRGHGPEEHDSCCNLMDAYDAARRVGQAEGWQLPLAAGEGQA